MHGAHNLLDILVLHVPRTEGFTPCFAAQRFTSRSSFCSVFPRRSPSQRAADKSLPTFTNPVDAGPDYKVQGEYVGELTIDGQARKVGMQVIALGDGKFDAEGYPGGLPGEGWDQSAGRRHRSGEMKGDVAVLKGEQRTGTIANSVITIGDADSTKIGELKKVERKSPTLGAKPPAGATVLFDGTSADKWNGGRLVDGGLLAPGCTSKQKFHDFQLHIEFQTPFMPTAQRPGPGQ